MDMHLRKLEEDADVDAAFIAGTDGTIKVQSTSLKIYPREIVKIVEAFQRSDEIRTTGLILGCQKYVCLQSDSKQIQGKLETNGVSIALTSSGQDIVAGFYNRWQSPGNCRAAVENVAESL